MSRFNLRSLVAATTLIVVLIAIAFYCLKLENEVERDLPLYGSTLMEDPEFLFAEVERLAKLGDDMQSWDSFELVP